MMIFFFIVHPVRAGRRPRRPARPLIPAAIRDTHRPCALLREDPPQAAVLSGRFPFRASAFSCHSAEDFFFLPDVFSPLLVLLLLDLSSAADHGRPDASAASGDGLRLSGASTPRLGRTCPGAPSDLNDRRAKRPACSERSPGCRRSLRPWPCSGTPAGPCALVREELLPVLVHPSVEICAKHAMRRTAGKKP